MWNQAIWETREGGGVQAGSGAGGLREDRMGLSEQREDSETKHGWIGWITLVTRPQMLAPSGGRDFLC